MAESCVTCQKTPLRNFFFCDEADGPWCGECFDETPCGKGEHGESCPTAVFDSDVEKEEV